MRARLMLIAAACSLFAVGAFVWLHSGPRGDAACERTRFVDSSGFSVWPPGAGCRYGEPGRTDIVINGWFAAVIVLVIVMFAVAQAALTARPRQLQPAGGQGGTGDRPDGAVATAPVPARWRDRG